MKLVEKNIPLTTLKKMASRTFGGLVKVVVDIKKGIMVVDGEMHADEEKILLEKGSKQDNLWGINIYPYESGDNFIEYDSLINVRPRTGNFSRNVEDKQIKEKIQRIINKLVVK